MKKEIVLKIRVILFITAVNIVYLLVYGQNPYVREIPVTFPEYINQVGKSNLTYLSEKYNVDIAKAEAIGERIFPDPELSVEYFDNGEFYKNDQMGYGVSIGLDYTLELGNKRKARINLANSQAELSSIILEQFFNELRAETSHAYLEAMKEKELLEVKKSSYEYVRQLYVSDSLRFSLGEISEIDVRQSRLEALTLLNEVYQQEAEYYSALAELNLNTGISPDSILLVPAGNWIKEKPDYSLPQLYTIALDNRLDIVAAMKNNEVAMNELKLVKAERKIDLGLSLGYEINSKIRNEEAETRAFNSIHAGISIPLKFSNTNKGFVRAAQYQIEQSKVDYRNIRLQIQTEVFQAFFNYEAARKQLFEFETGMLEDSERFLQGVTYTYKRGEASILEVLLAQRTYNEIQEQYLEAVKDYASSIIELQKSCGIWNIEL